MRYVDGSKQELLVSTPQFPALIIAHQEYDSANYHGHSGLEVLYAKDCPVSIGLDGQISILQPGQTRVIPYHIGDMAQNIFFRCSSYGAV